MTKEKFCERFKSAPDKSLGFSVFLTQVENFQLPHFLRFPFLFAFPLLTQLAKEERKISFPPCCGFHLASPSSKKISVEKFMQKVFVELFLESFYRDWKISYNCFLSVIPAEIQWEKINLNDSSWLALKGFLRKLFFWWNFSHQQKFSNPKILSFSKQHFLRQISFKSPNFVPQLLV